MKTVLRFVLAALVAGLLNLSPVGAAETNVTAPATNGVFERIRRAQAMSALGESKTNSDGDGTLRFQKV